MLNDALIISLFDTGQEDHIVTDAATVVQGKSSLLVKSYEALKSAIFIISLELVYSAPDGCESLARTISCC